MSDTLKMWASYGTAVVLSVGGAVGVFYLMLDGIISADVGVPVLAAWIGAAVGFLFGSESATRAVRSFERGLNTPQPAPPEPPREQP